MQAARTQQRHQRNPAQDRARRRRQSYPAASVRREVRARDFCASKLCAVEPIPLAQCRLPALTPGLAGAPKLQSSREKGSTVNTRTLPAPRLPGGGRLQPRARRAAALQERRRLLSRPRVSPALEFLDCCFHHRGGRPDLAQTGPLFGNNSRFGTLPSPEAAPLLLACLRSKTRGSPAGDQTLNLKKRISPSLTTYSLPSDLRSPFSLTACSEPRVNRSSEA